MIWNENRYSKNESEVIKNYEEVTRVEISRRIIEQVDRYRYLVSMMTMEWTSEQEITSIIAKVKEEFNKRNAILCSRMDLQRRKKLMNKKFNQPPQNIIFLH